MDAEEASRQFSPPYNVPWATFISTVDKVAADLPNRVDRTYLNSQSGGIQTYLLAAFRGFGFINDEYYVTPKFKDIIANGADRQSKMADLLREFYRDAVELGTTNATPGELAEAFRKAFPSVNGDSQKKAIRFFLAGAEYAGLPTSPLWKTGRARNGITRRVRAKKPAASGMVRTLAEERQIPNSPASMKQAYFNLLLKKAESQEELDTDLLNRIEKLIGLPDEATREHVTGEGVNG